NRGGTMLYTSRCEAFKTHEGLQKAADNCRSMNIDGIVTIGGDGTFRGAADLTQYGIPCIGVPGTIDNDVTATDSTIGYDTAMNTVVELVDKIRDTCESHARCNVVEVMGREAGDIAIHTALATGATAVAIKEYHFDEDLLFEKMKIAKLNGKRNFIVVVSEGRGKYFAGWLAEQIENNTGIVSNYARFAHVQRGGSPTLADRVLATRMGAYAVELLVEGVQSKVVALRGQDIVSFDIFLARQMDAYMKGKITSEQLDSICPDSADLIRDRVKGIQAYKKSMYEMVDIMSL
ncbi:MAG TPA: ATP-dependent 6-phosphofructokinase, partial [Bacillota bacterium]|nr:ATP-dependent 6-phosphofructokinase [Bacillota bacterium]